MLLIELKFGSVNWEAKYLSKIVSRGLIEPEHIVSLVVIEPGSVRRSKWIADSYEKAK